MNLEHVRCTEILPNPQSEGHPPADIEALAANIREHGVLRPVLLRPTPRGYVIVHGERRWRAARMAGLETIPACLVRDLRVESAAAVC
jgi:ParB family chromosome partitioning protein